VREYSRTYSSEEDETGGYPVLFAELCRQDAVRAGISLYDLDRVTKGDLIRNMLDALETASKRSN